MGLLLLIIMLLLLFASLPRWGYSLGWGYGPSGVLGMFLVVLLVLIFYSDVIPFSRF